MKVFDLHSDLFTDIAWRKSRGEKSVFDRVHYPKLKAGGITSIICVFWVEPKFANQSYERFKQLLTYVMEDLNSSKHAALSPPSSREKKLVETEKINIYLGLEGLTFMEDWEGETTLSKIENAFTYLSEHKIMHSIFAWNEHNFLATGTGADCVSSFKGLTDYGKIAVAYANRQNWVLDVSHLTETSFWDMYNTTNHPVIASHSNAKSICMHERNLTDEQIKAIAHRGGMIGLNAYGAFVDEEEPTIDRFIDHAVYIANLVGPQHLAFGFDFVDYLHSYDLGTASPVYTKGLEDASTVPDLLEKMSKRGFTNAELEAISFENAHSYITNHLIKRGSINGTNTYSSR
ncbi:membrane dipeptidase [Pseudobacillus sp. FSL P4-0506]|uniref:dipeptidase n=1 Tax=unclassified Pseudobacillus TaxID=2619284 RepID=UPI0030F9BB45